ncbi:MAG: lipid-binding protein [Porphyromonadaceae bacterium]|nr:lipid-binding protein [Porphyromonadaceae bacterium]
MKKILFLIAAICGLTSCQQKLDVWKSATYDYAGRFVFQIATESNPNTPIVGYGSHEIRMFNSAENKPNEIWVDDHNHIIPLKNYFVVSGNSLSFKSQSSGFDNLSNNLYQVGLPTPKEHAAPTAVGQIASVNRESVRAEILEGKIEPKAATTKGNNKADALFLKIKLYSGKVVFESVEKDKAIWGRPDKPEYEWRFKEVQPLSDSQVIIISGYRFTGFPEDKY